VRVKRVEIELSSEVYMASRDYRTASVAGLSALETNKVLKNTYLLLSATLGFSALMAGVSMAIGIGSGASMVCLFGAMGLGMFVLPRAAQSGAGLGLIFLITGLLGLALGPIISMYLSLSNGPQVVATALGGTAVMFLGLSAYVISSKRDFSFMGGFITVGFFVTFAVCIANFVLQLTLVSLMVSIAVILLSSALILLQTGSIIRGGETNYILATYTLYLSIFNIFVSLLQLLGWSGGDD
jgi:modulator of FtsH protease